MNDTPNIYKAVMFDLHPRIKEFLDSLDQAGQIDRDEFNTPHILAVERPAGSVRRCIFMRNGKQENFILHTRKRAEPFRSWRDDDGFMRKEQPSVVVDVTSRKERDRRKIHPFECIIEQILPKR